MGSSNTKKKKSRLVGHLPRFPAAFYAVELRQTLPSAAEQMYSLITRTAEISSAPPAPGLSTLRHPQLGAGALEKSDIGGQIPRLKAAPTEH